MARPDLLSERLDAFVKPPALYVSVPLRAGNALDVDAAAVCLEDVAVNGDGGEAVICSVDEVEHEVMILKILKICLGQIFKIFKIFKIFDIFKIFTIIKNSEAKSFYSVDDSEHEGTMIKNSEHESRSEDLIIKKSVDESRSEDLIIEKPVGESLFEVSDCEDTQDTIDRMESRGEVVGAPLLFHLGISVGGYVGDKYKTASECLIEALHLNPKHSDSWHHLGLQGGGTVYGKRKTELECFILALRINPKLADA